MNQNPNTIPVEFINKSDDYESSSSGIDPFNPSWAKSGLYESILNDNDQGKKKFESLVLNPNEVIEKKFLGKGGFGSVCQAIWKKKNKVVAMKRISYQKIRKLRIIQEAYIMKKIRKIAKKHQDVRFIKFYGTLKDPNRKEILLMMECGDLSVDQEMKKHIYSKNELKDFAFSLTNQLYFLQKYRISHGDVKPKNVIRISKKDDPNKNDYLLIDFGLSRRNPKNSDYIRTSIFGFSKDYWAPEIEDFYNSIKNKIKKEDSKIYYSPFRADVFSLGIMLGRMMSKEIG